jgi:hypothetical protein
MSNFVCASERRRLGPASQVDDKRNRRGVG